MDNEKRFGKSDTLYFLAILMLIVTILVLGFQNHNLIEGYNGMVQKYQEDCIVFDYAVSSPEYEVDLNELREDNVS